MVGDATSIFLTPLAMIPVEVAIPLGIVVFLSVAVLAGWFALKTRQGDQTDVPPPNGEDKPSETGPDGETESEDQEAQDGEEQSEPGKGSSDNGTVGNGGKGTISSENRGGRPRGTKINGTRSSDSSFLRPGIVCWKHDGQWRIGVQIEGVENVKISQGIIELQQAHVLHDTWLLRTLSENIRIAAGVEGEPLHRLVPLGSDFPHVFRLSGQGWDQGRLVSTIGRGFYLAVTPANWKRAESAGPVPVAPEPVDLSDSTYRFLAHYFDQTEDAPILIAFDTPDGATKEKSRQSSFSLQGNPLCDHARYYGPLFGCEPPEITIHHGKWDDVGTIVYGQEGPGGDRWREAVADPKTDNQLLPKANNQPLPEALLQRKAGWYFARFYDRNDTLMDSLDFRLVPGVRSIEYPSTVPFPAADGHEQAIVRIRHDRTVEIKPAKGNPLHMVQNVASDGLQETSLIIPPQADRDESQWHIYAARESQKVDLVVRIDRIWWALGNVGDRPDSWGIEVLLLSREDFSATSNKALWLRFPCPRWHANLRVGLNERHARPYRTLMTEQDLCVPLREVDVDAAIAAGGADGQNLNMTLWVDKAQGDDRPSDAGRGQGSIALATIILRFKCRICDFRAENEEDIWSHALETETHRLYSELDWKEYQRHVPDLPRKIYKCGHCDDYVKADLYDPTNDPTTAILRHLDEYHRGLPRGFRPVIALNEIRECVFANIPVIYKCGLCSQIFRGNGPEDFSNPIAQAKEHLKTQHRDDIVAIFQECQQ